MTATATATWPARVVVHSADSASRYKIARGEAMECAASLDVMQLRKLSSDERYACGVHLLEGIVAMLTRMF